ncbi:prepilin peptidase [Vallitalea maricola]|uniref:Uncharacterized protein n=1 Tax=Vallitalea maricola TaxID=3074433 RepID=A0ACB5UPL5_9FIRM|nr:hypothetical protein AN2V17_37270 [Vallitalea sp. AN17-2]
MSIVIILIGLALGILTYSYSFDTNLNIFSSNNKNRIKGLLIVIGVTTVTYLFYYQYQLTNYFIAMELTTWFLIITTIRDCKDKQIPMDVVIITFIIGVILLFFNPNVIWIHSLIGFVGIGGIIALISVLTKGAIGIGDALVIGTIGLILGYKMAIAVLLYSLVLSGLIGLGLMVFGKVTRKTKLPMVPFMLCAFLIIIIL